MIVRMKKIVNVLRTYYIPFFFLSALSIYICQQLKITLPAFINNYANDFFCLPLVLFACQYVIRKIKGDKSIEIPLATVFVLTLFYALYFEWYLPKINVRYTSDSIDIALYFTGASLFCLLERSNHCLEEVVD